MVKSDIGIIGLAVMGENLALNLAHKGYRVSLYNRQHNEGPQVVDTFLNGRGVNRNFTATYSPKELLLSLKRPRKIMLLIRAGEPIDEMISQLHPHLEKGDTLIDGGNSDYRETQRRESALRKDGIYWVGCGISGGELGALHGPSMMPGGDENIKKDLLPLLQTIAARLDDGTPCCAWIGPNGSGHFVKMVHNGIEYGDMQLIAEAYSLLNILQMGNHEETAQTFEQWNRGTLNSYLIGITAPILRKRESDGSFLIDKISDRANQKGSGKLSVKAALATDTPFSIPSEAVYARFLSRRCVERKQVFKLYPKVDASPIFELDINEIHHALYAAKIMTYVQGFDLLHRMSIEQKWNLNLTEIATIWQKGCIIQSRFLHDIATAYRSKKCDSLLLCPFFQEKLSFCLPAWRKVVRTAVMAGIPLPGISAALNCFDSWRTHKSAANLIQAQRNYFGTHLYERVDAPEGTFFHTDWNNLGDNPTAENYTA